MKAYRLIILLVLLVSCQTETKKLFWINHNTKHTSDFLEMAESTNILPVSADSADLFLNWDEVKETGFLDSKIRINDTLPPYPVIYKNFGEIFKSDNFKIYVIFRDGNDTIGRDYKFMLRTYTHDWKIIDTYDLAIWNYRKNQFCFGSIDNNLIIERRCKDSELPEIMQILENGKIVMTSFHKP